MTSCYDALRDYCVFEDHMNTLYYFLLVVSYVTESVLSLMKISVKISVYVNENQYH